MSVNREKFIIEILSQYLKIPYICGGSDPKIGLDCSGLVQLILSKISLDPVGDQTANGLMEHFIRNSSQIDIKDADLGDLIFFGRHDHATHVGFCLGNNYMIEAGGGDSSCINEKISKEKNAYIRVRSTDRRPDRLCILRVSGVKF